MEFTSALEFKISSQQELVAEIQKGINTEENKAQLYKQNRGLILKVAKKYMTNDDELEDFISEGYFAIEKACNYYEMGKGASFSTILYSFLRTSFRDYLCRCRLVRIPYWVRENDVKYSKAKTGLLMERGEATDTEIMKKGITESNIEFIKAA